MLDLELKSTAESGHHFGAMDILRFTTAGSVDDGKSTLIGRLLYDAKGVYEDQLASIRKTGINRSSGPIDLSLFTDGLRAEREQGITIDVAYRHFSTPRRRFIIADTPGHEQYTRNMATGASTADLAIILVDANKGLLAQSRRHTYIAALLGIQNIVVAVNKMDLVDYRQDVFEEITADFQKLASQLNIQNVYAVPVSALHGDNIVHPGSRFPWFTGATLLEHLETVQIKNTNNFPWLRLPIQTVIRPDSTFRGFAGQIASGTLRQGDPVVAFPSGIKTRIKGILSFDGELSHASAQSSITVTLEDEIDLGRGDLLAGEVNPPRSSTNFSAKLVWLHSTPCEPGKLYLLKHTTRLVRARVTKIAYGVNVNTLDHLPPSNPRMNDIVAAHIETTLPLFFDPYRRNRTMGSFILIDPMTHATVAAGMIEESVEKSYARTPANKGRVGLHERILRTGHAPAALWIVGREPVAEKLERVIFERGWQALLVSGSELTAEEFEPVAAMLRRTGIISIFSLEHENSTLRKAIENVYGAESFFHLQRPGSSDSEAMDQVLKWLSQPQKNLTSPN